MSRKKKLFFFLIMLTVLFVFGFGLFETLVRLQGFRPYEVPVINLRVEPGGRLYESDPELGYVNLPGRYRLIFPSGHAARITVGPDHLRVTGPDDLRAKQNESNKDEIWISGCSFAFGYSLHDEETFPWLLQERMPGYVIRNFGTSGYGTVSSLLQFKRALRERERKPKLVVYAYGQFHDPRNVARRFRRKGVAPVNFLGDKRLPYAELKRDGSLVFSAEPIEYTEWPFMRRSAFVHYLEMAYNDLEQDAHQARAVTEALIKEFERVATENGILFMVVTVKPDVPMLIFLKNAAIYYGDISFDLNDPTMWNLPHDMHPSPLANRRYADGLRLLVERLLEK